MEDEKGRPMTYWGGNPEGKSPSSSSRCSTSLGDMLKAMAEAAKGFEPCMSLVVSKDGQHVELCLDTSLSTVSEWIPGEGGDISLTRCGVTGRVVGVLLPLLRDNLSVHHDGPIRINAGFRRGERA